MNERIQELAEQTGMTQYVTADIKSLERFAELVIQGYLMRLVEVNMSNPEYAKAMDKYYEMKWAHRFD